MILFSKHALSKFEILKRHGWELRRENIEEAIMKPDRVESGRKGRRIAQKKIGEEHVLRVVYEMKKGNQEVITFYPGRRSRYETQL